MDPLVCGADAGAWGIVFGVGHVDVNTTRHSLFDGAWSAETFLEAIDPSIVLAADSTPRMATWATQSSTWTVMYALSASEFEAVAEHGIPSLTNATLGLALDGAVAPWLLFLSTPGWSMPNEIHLAHRTGPATWTLEPVADSANPEAKSCPGGLEGPQPEPGELCDYDDLTVYPLALFASGDDVRAVYLRYHRKGTVMANCEGFPCIWGAVLTVPPAGHRRPGVALAAAPAIFSRAPQFFAGVTVPEGQGPAEATTPRRAVVRPVGARAPGPPDPP